MKESDFDDSPPFEQMVSGVSKTGLDNAVKKVEPHISHQRCEEEVQSVKSSMITKKLLTVTEAELRYLALVDLLCKAKLTPAFPHEWSQVHTIDCASCQETINEDRPFLAVAGGA